VGTLTMRTDTTVDASLRPGFGAVDGVIVDAKTAEPLAGVTVILVPTAGSEEVAITDDLGTFRVTAGAGSGELDTYYMDDTFKQAGLAVRAGEVVHVRIELVSPPPQGEIIRITAD
jgi:hypothetical protein